MSKNFSYDPLFILVTGATGNQAGSVARRLLEHGHRVRALTRKPDSPAANELEKLGAEISVGNFNDRIHWNVQQRCRRNICYGHFF